MSINLGNKELSTIRFGGKEVSQVRLGNKLVWNRYTLEEIPLVIQDLAKWREDLPRPLDYTIKFDVNKDSYDYKYYEPFYTQYIKCTASTGTFKFECIKSTTSTSPRYVKTGMRMNINRTDGLPILKPNKFYKIHFKIRGKITNFLSSVSNVTFSLGFGALIHNDFRTNEAKYGGGRECILSETEWLECDYVYWTGKRAKSTNGTMNDSFIDVTSLEFYNGNKTWHQGDFVEISDFRFKECSYYPPMPNNKYYTELATQKMTFDTFNLCNLNSDYESSVKNNVLRFEQHYQKVTVDENGNQVLVGMPRKVRKTFDEDWISGFEFEPYRRYKFRGYVKGTPNKHGGLMVGYISLFDEFNVKYNDYEWTYFEFELPRMFTAYYRSDNRCSLTLGFNEYYNDTDELILDYGDFIEVKNLVITRID